MILAVVDQQIVGLVEVVFSNFTAGDDHYASKRASIEYLYVLPQYRRLGIGHSLIESAAVWSKKKGRDVLAVSVYEVNHDAIELYRHTKFKPHVSQLERKL